MPTWPCPLPRVVQVGKWVWITWVLPRMLHALPAIQLLVLHRPPATVLLHRATARRWFGLWLATTKFGTTIVPSLERKIQIVVSMLLDLTVKALAATLSICAPAAPQCITQACAKIVQA